MTHHDGRKRIVEEVFRSVKSQAWLARELGLTRGTLQFWRHIPHQHVRKISELTGISMKRLRPDLYDPNYKAR